MVRKYIKKAVINATTSMLYLLFMDNRYLILNARGDFISWVNTYIEVIVLSRLTIHAGQDDKKCKIEAEFSPISENIKPWKIRLDRNTIIDNFEENYGILTIIIAANLSQSFELAPET